MSAIYFHVPFCKRICGYCDFFKSVNLKNMEATLDEMSCELDGSQHFFDCQHVDGKSPLIETIYFGGGTPSIVEASRIDGYIKQVRSLFHVSDDCEITLEANPDDLSREYLEKLYNAGVNRLSIGIQSFNDEELCFMNRRHTSLQAVETVKTAQEVGFNNITIDLIFGVDGFDENVLNHTIDVALSLNIQHISAYHLTIEPGTLFGSRLARGEMSVVDESVSEKEYALLEKRLCDAGFEHYEVSNYALKGHRSRHNSSYWRGVAYLGIGAGAHSFDGVRRRVTAGSIKKYLAGGDDRYEIENLTEVDRYNEMVMTSLRCVEGVNLNLLRNLFPDSYYDFLMTSASKWIETGVLVERDGWLSIPSERFLLSDAVIESLFFVE